MRNINIILVLFFLFPLLSSAQEVKLKIFDKITNESLEGATIIVNQTGYFTDENGEIVFSDDEEKYSIHISYVGYIELDTVIASGINQIEIRLVSGNYLLDEVTVSSGKFGESLKDVPVSIEIIKPHKLIANNSVSFDELLSQTSGITISDGQASIRGGAGFSYGAGSRILFLIDDLPALQADAGSVNWNDIPVENIAQVEILKGASSALYGSSALNGVINIRTAFAKSKPETKFSISNTTFLSPKNRDLKWWTKPPNNIALSLWHARKIKKLDLISSVFYVNENSYRKDTYDKYIRFIVNSRYSLTDNTSIYLNANVNLGNSSYYFHWKGLDSLYQGNEATINSSSKIRGMIDPKIIHYDRFGNSHRLTGRYYFVTSNTSYDNSVKSDLFYSEYQFQRKITERDIVFTSGLVNQKTYVDAELYGDTTYQSTNYAIYAQFDKKFYKKLKLTLGVRYEYNILKSPEFVANDTIPDGITKEGRPVFRVGVGYPLAKSTILRTSFGQGYRYPTIAEKFITSEFSGLEIIPNPKLNSETGWSYEVGLKQGLKFGSNIGFVDATYFITNYNDMMEFTFDLSQFKFSAQNIGNVRVSGLELVTSIKGVIDKLKYDIYAGYTFLNPKFKEFTDEISNASSVDYNILKYRIRNNTKFDINLTYRKMSFGVSGVLASKMEAIDNILNIIPGLYDFRLTHNGYNVFDMRAGYDFGSFRFMVYLKNVLNEEYSTRPALLDAPRSVGVRLFGEF